MTHLTSRHTRLVTSRHTLLALVTGLALVTPGVWAQSPQTPSSGAQQSKAPGSGSHDAPRPDELEPGVNTSATPPASGPASAAPAPAATSATGTASSATAPASDAAGTGAGAAGSSKATGRAKPANGGKSEQDKKANAARGGKAEDHLQLDTTDITGNQELPKVLYIVPWKRSDLGDLVGKPPNSLLDEVLEPVDRDVFKRENRYYDALKPDAAGGAAGAGQNSGEKR